STTSSCTNCRTAPACRRTRSCGARVRSTLRPAGRAPARAWRSSITRASCAWARASPAGAFWASTSRAASPARPWSRAAARFCRRSPARPTSRASASSSSIPAIPCGPDSSSTRDPMKTLVLGGGVVGVTTAYFLAKAGHEVTILEEKDALGLEASAGNAGIIARASPRAPRMLWDSLRGGETAIRLRLGTDVRLYTWGLRFLRECTADRARRNTLIKLRLCQYSQGVMSELVRAEQIEYHAIIRG